MDRDDCGNFLVGLGLGVVAGMLFAPQTGAETRGMLRDRAGQGREYLRERGSGLRDSANELIERGREMMSRQRDHLREAIDAGKQAYRETVDRPAESPDVNPNPTL